MKRYCLKARVLWRALRDGFARLSHLIAETGNSDEDLVFRVQNFEPEYPLSDRTGRAPDCPKLVNLYFCRDVRGVGAIGRSVHESNEDGKTDSASPMSA